VIALWDLGNVVVQWSPSTIVGMLDLPESKATLFKEALLDTELWLDLDRGLTDELSVAEQLAGQTALNTEDLINGFQTVRRSLIDLPRSIELLYEMKSASIPMYVLSNMSTANADYLLSRDYFELFNGVVISAEEQLIKPDPAIFQLVLDRFQLNPHEVVFIDDSLPNIESAKSLGMQGVHFNRTDHCYEKIRKCFALS